jgi:hypothetical protein
MVFEDAKGMLMEGKFQGGGCCGSSIRERMSKEEVGMNQKQALEQWFLIIKHVRVLGLFSA